MGVITATMEKPKKGDTSVAADPTDAEDGFGKFFDRYADDVLLYFYRRTGDPHTAADLMAETFAAALLSRENYRPELGHPRAWLFGIARHELHNWFRRGRVRDKALSKLGIPKVGVDDVSLERIEAMIDLTDSVVLLDAAMQRLSPSVAQAVKLRIGYDMSFEEVAQRLNCTVGAARVRVSRGLTQLAEEFDEHGDGND